MAHIPGTGHATAKRSLLKTITWRTIGAWSDWGLEDVEQIDPASIPEIQHS